MTVSDVPPPASISQDEIAFRTASGRAPVVLQIVPVLGPGGAEQGCIDVATAVVRAGGKAIVVSNGGHRVPEILRAGVTHVTLPVDSKNPLVIWRNIARARALIRRYRVDIVHARSRAPAWSALKACEGTSARFVTTCHAPYAGTGKLKTFYNSVMARGDRVIAISDFIARYLRKTFALDPGRIRTIPRGIALERFQPRGVSAHRLVELTRKWRLPDGASVVMMPGRLTRWKGHSVLIEAMRRLTSVRPDLFCVLIGSDQGRSGYTKELTTLIREKKLEGRVRIVDHCDDMSAAYMLATVVVSASTEPEGFGRVPVEAQAMGRPVVATDHGGARETILRAETGWLVPPNDSKALAQAIDEALSLSAQERDVLAAHAIDHVTRNFSRELMVARTLAVYAELLDGMGRGAGRKTESATATAGVVHRMAAA